MKKVKIQWKCTLDKDWEWLSIGFPQTGIPQETLGVSELSGIIELPLNHNYWYPCVRVVLQNVAYGDAMLRCYSENGKVFIQTQTVAQNKWLETGNIGTESSNTNAKGGINLSAKILN